MRDEEQLCRDQFTRYLLHHQIVSPHEYRWRSGDEPPDYYLHVRHHPQPYAVEVTALIDNQLVDGQKLYYLHNLWDKALGHIEAEARRLKLLRGQYVLSTAYSPTDKTIKRRLRLGILEYLEATHHLPTAPSEPILGEDETLGTIRKVNGHHHQLTFLPVFKAWGESQTRALLETVLKKKVSKMAHLSHPKILLLHDRYGIEQQANYQAALQTLECRHEFVLVFWVAPFGEREMLYGAL